MFVESKRSFHFGTYVEALNGFFRNKVSTFLLSDWLNETEHAINLNTCSWRVQEKAGFMKSRWLFFTTDQWIRNGRTSKSQRICRGNLMFFSRRTLRWVSQQGNFTHSFRRLELRNDSTRQDDKARLVRLSELRKTSRRELEELIIRVKNPILSSVKK